MCNIININNNVLLMILILIMCNINNINNNEK